MSFVCLLLLSCGDSQEDSILNHPPYDRLSDSIRKDPANADLHYHRGSLLYSNNESVYAESDIREAWQLQHKEEYALSLTTILKKKNTDSAILFLQQAIKAVRELCDPEGIERVFAAAAQKRAGRAAWTLLFYALWHRRHIEGRELPPDTAAALSES